MDVGKKQAVQAVCMLICSDKTHKKGKDKEFGLKEWIRTRRRQGLNLLQRELEVTSPLASLSHWLWLVAAITASDFSHHRMSSRLAAPDI